MRQLFFIALFFVPVLGFNSTQEADSIQTHEAEIERLSQLILGEIPDREKDSINLKLKTLLKESLVKEACLTYPFSTLKSIATLVPSDSSFRLFNWSIPYSDGTYQYECAILHSVEGIGLTITFLDQDSALQSNEEEEKLTKNIDQWLGASYYQIIEKETRLKKYYTLLGFDGNDLLTNKKYIDVLWFDRMGNIKLGAPIFKNNRKKSSRIIFEYGGQHAMKLNYDAKADHIIFDYLVPLNSRLEGVFEYYYPDVTQDAYKWEENTWVLYKLVDGDETLKKSKRNFPTYNKSTIQEQQPLYAPK